MKFVICEYCGVRISNNNINKHKGSLKCRGLYRPRKTPKDAFCKTCNKQFSNNGIGTHIWKVHTELGRNHKPTPVGSVAWNKGLTSKDNPKLRNGGIAFSLKYKGTKGRKHTEQSKKNMSEARKKMLLLHPENHPNRLLANNRKKMTYPERVAFDYLNKINVDFENQKKIGRFFVDFCIGKIVIEIDGERWHSSPEQVRKDFERDNIITSLGFSIYRIKSKERIEERIQQILSERGPLVGP